MLEQMEPRYLLAAAPLAFMGDADRDYQISGGDFATIDAHLNTTQPRWLFGDVNGDTQVTGDDYPVVDANLGTDRAVPSYSNSGHYGNPATFTTYSSDVTITTAGTTFQNFRLINGATIEVAANNVTIRNGIVENPNEAGGNAIGWSNNGYTGALVEYVTVFGGNVGNAVKIPVGGRVSKCHFYDLHADGVRIRSDATVEYCYIHNFDLSTASGTHGDGVQRYPVDGPNNSFFLYNHIDARNADAALFHVSRPATTIGNVLRGGDYTVQSEGYPDVVFHDNYWGNDAEHGPIGTGNGNEADYDWDNNRWLHSDATFTP